MGYRSRFADEINDIAADEESRKGIQMHCFLREHLWLIIDEEFSQPCRTYSIHYSLQCTVVACQRPGILMRARNLIIRELSL